MPVYFILSKSNFTSSEKKELVSVVTDIHCSVTGAPSRYVTVLFLSGYRLKEGRKVMLLGNIRLGGNRTKETIDKLELGLIQGMANMLLEPSTKVGLQLLGVHSDWVWEGGEVLPPPGEEKLFTSFQYKNFGN